MLTELFELQKELDRRIEKEHSLEQADLMDKKILALLVELGELANETRCFKFWSKKPAAERNVILEEYVDGIHFILSIGIDLNVQNDVKLLPVEGSRELVDQFHAVFSSINKFHHNQTLKSYQKLFDAYILLGGLLGFSLEEIEKAYKMKNEVNHQRQDQGY